MRVAVVFDTPYSDWTPERHAEELVREWANRKQVEPEMEYQVAKALQNNGHDVILLGVYDDLRDMSARLAEWKPDLVFNATEAFRDNAELDYLIPAVLRPVRTNPATLQRHPLHLHLPQSRHLPGHRQPDWF